MNATNRQPRAINRTTHAQFYQTTQWLEKRRREIVETRPQVKNLCEEIAKELGFPVSNATLKEAADSIGLVWKSSQAGHHDGGVHTKSMMRNSLVELVKIVASVASVVEDMHRSLTSDVPAKLTTA